MYDRGVFALVSTHLTQIMLIKLGFKEYKNKQLTLNDMNGTTTLKEINNKSY